MAAVAAAASASAAAASASVQQQLLGEDGRGYELARRLEACGVWRAWLGEAAYSGFAHSLASPAAWEAFMRADAAVGKTRSQIHLQLRARALLFDKASVSLFLSPSAGGGGGPSRGSSSSHRPSIQAAPSLSNLNPAYLQLHGDDVYFSLEGNAPDGMQHQQSSGAPQPNMAQSMAQSRAAFSSYYDRKSTVESRYNDTEIENMAQRARLDELPETWYSQCAERFKKGKPWKFPLGDRESNKRTPDGMSAYMKLLEAHRKKRQAFREETYMGTAIPMRDNGSRFHLSAVQDMSSSVDDDTCLLPEMMFPSNCVPDNALPPPNTQEENQKVDVYGVLDSLPHLISQSPAMMERFGIRPEYLKVEFRRSQCRGKYGPDGSRKLSPEQASQMTQKVIAHVLSNVGLESGTEVSMEVLSKFMAAHICKLGRILKVLTDSYRKQLSSTELLKMFVQTTGLGSFAALADHIKDANKNLSHQNQQHVRAVQAYPNHLQQQQMNQIQRPVQAQLNTSYSQNFAFQHQLQQQQQQQLQQLRKRQVTTPRGSGMTVGNGRPMVEVKMENVVESATDGTFNSLNKQQQFRHQQMAMSSHHVQSAAHQFKQMASVQVPQLQTQNSFSMRTPPVKVEGFEELMGGDTTLKHDNDEHKLTSPSK